ncbi:MAG: hypothetical protein ACOX1V_03310 [Candidatus Iainarchaeum sp.]|jgi:uncharacterized protein (UPF0333 family)|nr:MAG: hypothetical protein BWY55_00395 [archaeon ADurb.Bin336]
MKKFVDSKSLRSRAQGTIEYLVIIAVVVVVSLTTVNLVVNMVGQSSGVSEESAKLAWKMANPFAIVEWSMNPNGVMTIALKNNSDKTVFFNYMNIGQDWNNDSFSLAVGQTKNITINTGDNYSSGQNYAYKKPDIVIDYNTIYISNSRQYAPTDLVGKVS